MYALCLALEQRTQILVVLGFGRVKMPRIRQDQKRRHAVVAIVSRAGDVPPATIRITYQMVGPSHVFESPDLEGLYVGDVSLAEAFALVIPGVKALTRAIWKSDVDYKLDVTLDEFKRRITGEGVEDSELLTSTQLLAEIKMAA